MLALAGRTRRALADVCGVFVIWMPGRIGSDLRKLYYKARGATIGRGVRLDVGVILDTPGRIRIGDTCWIDRYAILIAGIPRGDRETRSTGESAGVVRGSIEIGRRCHVGPYSVLSGLGGLKIGDDVTLSAGSKIYTLTHHYRSWQDPSNRLFAFGSMASADRQSVLEGPIIIDFNVGIAVDALILPGTHIRAESFVRPRTTVSGEWPPNSIIAGDPARRDGDRFTEKR